MARDLSSSHCHDLHLGTPSHMWTAINFVGPKAVDGYPYGSSIASKRPRDAHSPSSALRVDFSSVLAFWPTHFLRRLFPNRVRFCFDCKGGGYLVEPPSFYHLPMVLDDSQLQTFQIWHFSCSKLDAASCGEGKEFQRLTVLRYEESPR